MPHQFKEKKYLRVVAEFCRLRWWSSSSSCWSRWSVATQWLRSRSTRGWCRQLRSLRPMIRRLMPPLGRPAAASGWRSVRST